MRSNLSLFQNLAIFVCPNPSTRSSCGPMTNSSLFQASDLNPPDMNPCPLTPLTPPRLLSRRCSVAKGVDIYIKCKSFSICPSTTWSKETFILKKSRRDEVFSILWVDSFLRREPLLLVKIPIDAFFTLHHIEDAPLHGSFRTLASKLRQDPSGPSGAQTDTDGRTEIGDEILLF